MKLIKIKLNKAFQKLRPSIKNRKYQQIAVIVSFFILLIGFQNCGGGQIDLPGGRVDTVSVINLEFDKASGTWSWSCNRNNCQYRYIINQSATDHTTINNRSYGEKTTAPVPAGSETYYIHVQAQDTDTQAQSEVESLSTSKSPPSSTTSTTNIDTTTTTVTSTTLPPDVLQVINLKQETNTLSWDCNQPACQFRHAINQDPSYTFPSEQQAPYSEEKTAPIPTEPGTHHIHVQAKKETATSAIARHSVTIATPEPTLKSQISTGNRYSCHLNGETGSVKCWGSNIYGQLGSSKGNGDSDTDSKRLIGDAPDEIQNLSPINLGSKAKAIATSRRGIWRSCDTECAEDDGTVNQTCKNQCEAENEINERAHTCAILDNDKVKCWGANHHGQLGQGDRDNRGDQANEIASLGIVDLGNNHTVKAIALGSQHTCAILDNNKVKCWGWNQKGQLGYGSAGQGSLGKAPREMGTYLDYVGGANSNFKAKAITAGYQHTCAIRKNGNVTCWGFNASGQLGYDDNIDYTNVETELLNKSVNLSIKAKSIASGGYHTCAILDNDKVKCWGLNSHGQLGQGTKTTYNDDNTIANNHNIGDEQGEMAQLQYIDLGSNRKAKAITAGLFHTCVLLDNEEMKCWGFNKQGQLGIGNNQNANQSIGDQADEMGGQLKSVPTNTLREVVGISAGSTNSCFILDNDDVKCWGHNWFGQLGQGNKGTIESDGTVHNRNIGDTESILSIQPIPLPNN